MYCLNWNFGSFTFEFFTYFLTLHINDISQEYSYEKLPLQTPFNLSKWSWLVSTIKRVYHLSSKCHAIGNVFMIFRYDFILKKYNRLKSQVFPQDDLRKILVYVHKFLIDRQSYISIWMHSLKKLCYMTTRVYQAWGPASLFNFF